MKISEREVHYVADLANLELAPDEVSRMQRDLSAILDYVEQLNQLDTSNVEPLAQVLGGQTPEHVSAVTMRPDQQRTWFRQEDALANAPASGAGHFKVPKIIERS